MGLNKNKYMNQNIDNQIPVPKPPKSQQIENSSISDLDLNKTERSESAIKSLEPSVSDLKFKKFIKLILIGTGVIFALLVFFGWLGYNDIFYLGPYLPNIDISNEQFLYFFIFLALIFLSGSIFLVGKLFFNKKTPYSTSKSEVIIFALVLFLIFLFVYFQFVSPFFY